MKKQLLLLSVVLVTIPLFGQADLQWLVLKGSGKNGTSSSTTNNYSFPFGGTTTFNLDGITHPDISIYPYNKNDLFIIYQNGTFYNSRVTPPQPNPGFFYDSNPANVSHDFSSSQPILYLYLTNIYEKDDPPHGVKAKAGSQPHQDAFTIPPASASSPEPVSASHDVVRNSDITLILDKAKIFADAAAQNLDVPDTFDFDIYFNSIFPAGRPDLPIYNAFFLPYPVFKANAPAAPDVAIYPDGFGTYFPNTNKISIRKNCPQFMYVNLKPSSALTPYYPAIDGNVLYQAGFTVTTDAGQPIFALNEDIRSSHDPNFVRIDSICKNTADEQIVFCHLEFENDSHTAPNSIQVNFGLPASAESSCFEILEWNLGGESVSGDFSYSSSSKKAKCVFNMTGAPSIQKCDSPLDEPQCTGYINFKYRIKDSEPVEILKTLIFVRGPKVSFDGSPNSVKDFQDLIDTRFIHGSYISSRPFKIRSGCMIDCSH